MVWVVYLKSPFSKQEQHELDDDSHELDDDSH